MDKKLHNILERALKTTTSLAEMGTENESPFLNVLLGVYRVSFSTLRDIYYRDAVSWQIREVSTAQLQADATKVNSNLAAARADIQTLSK